MQEKKILIDGVILNYYTNIHSITSSQPSPLGEKEQATNRQQYVASLSSKGEGIQGGGNKKYGILVFLHGWMQDGRSFEKIFQILEERNIPYISLDLPGFGKSQLIHDSMSIEEYGEITQKCIQKLGLKNPILVGHSFGGRISIFLGSFYKNISKIILIGAAGIQREMPLMRKIVVKCAKKIFSVPGLQKIGEKIRENNISIDAKKSGKMEKIFRNTVSRDLTPEMQKNNCPTLMIWGQDDDQVSLEDAKIMSGYMKNSQLKIFPGGHFVFQERPEEITQQILEYIKK